MHDSHDQKWENVLDKHYSIVTLYLYTLKKNKLTFNVKMINYYQVQKCYFILAVHVLDGQFKKKKYSDKSQRPKKTKQKQLIAK